MLRQIAKNFAGVDVGSASTRRNRQHNIATAFTRTVFTHTILPALRFMEALKTIVDKGIQVFIGLQVDIATIAAVTTVGTTFGNVLLATETDTTITAVTRIYADFYFINEFHRNLLLIT